jgi:hypothetical protein
MSRCQIEGRNMKHSVVTVANLPRIQSAVNFLVMEANVIIYIFYAGSFCRCGSIPRTEYRAKCLE